MWALMRDDIVAEIIPNSDIPLEERFCAPVVAMMVKLTAKQAKTVQPGWVQTGSTFSEPPAPGDAAPAAPIRVIRSLAFRDRLGPEKQAALSVAAMQAAAAGDGSLMTFLLNQAASVTTSLDDARVQAGVQALRAAELVTGDEADAMLADGTPDEAD